MSRVKRSRREVETMEYAGFARRAIRAYGRRVGECDPVDLAEMLAIRAEFDRAIEAAVMGQRKTFSWGQIAEGIGMPRQNVFRKYSHLETNADRETIDVAETSSVA